MKTKTKNTILAIITTIVAIIFPSLLLNKIIEGLFFLLCHWLIREQFPEQYHHIIPATCRLITATVFFFGVCFVLPIELSLLSAIPINYFIGWVGFTKKQADIFELKYYKLKRQLEKDSNFTVENCSENDLIKRCKECNLSEENTKLAIEFFIKKTKQSKLADDLCINEKSVQIRKKRLKEKLNNYTKK